MTTVAHGNRQQLHDTGESAYAGIRDLVSSLYRDDDDAREQIMEDPLSVLVRSGWYRPGETPEAEEYEILLSTGGPATRIIGQLDHDRAPSTATLQAQDWGTSWADYLPANESVLLSYAECFYFGE